MIHKNSEIIDYAQWLNVPKDWHIRHCKHCGIATYREKGICSRCDPEVRAGLIAAADRNDARPALGMGKRLRTVFRND